MSKIIGLVNSCRDCPNRRYESGGVYQCEKAGGNLEGNCSIPDWCPLPNYQPPTVDNFSMRGKLAASLKCWHRLTGEESDELVALFAAKAAQPSQAGELSDEEILAALRSITNEPPVRLPPGWKNFARAIIAAINAKGQS